MSGDFRFSFGLEQLFGPDGEDYTPDDIQALLSIRDREVEDFLGTSSQTGDWVNMTFVNSWTNFVGLGAPASYRIDAQGIVNFRGWIAAGTAAQFSVLPASIFPQYNLTFPCLATATTLHQVQVATNGSISDDSGLPTFLSLDAIRYQRRTA